MNRSLSAAKAAKQDEFYSQYIDIQKEIEAYLEFNPDTFRNKIVYCNCDDPFESNFFQYFALLKQADTVVTKPVFSTDAGEMR